MESEGQNRLVVFDVEGILIPKVRFTLFDIVGRLGAWPFVQAAFFGLLYEMGLRSVKNTMKNIYKLLKGLPLERFISLFQEVPLMPGVEDAFEELKRSGFKIALISSGIPQVALAKLAERLGADYVSGLEIGLSEGCLTGEIWGDVIEPNGKATALQNLLIDKELTNYHCIGVADDRNNLSMFKLCNLKIGCNPDFLLIFKSDYVVKGDLSKIVPIVRGEYPEGKSQYLSKNILLREVIHLTGFSVSLVCTYLINRYIVASLILLVAVLYTISEIERMFGNRMPIISDLTSRATGKSEFQEFVASPTFYALGIAMSLMVFPEPIGYVSTTVLTLGDGFASIFGSKFGKRVVPFNKNKRIEGTVCGFFFAFLGSLLFIDPLRALVASAVGMLTESIPTPINDNLMIPFASGLALMVFTLV